MTGLVDVERHVLVPSLTDLLPYIDHAWAHRMRGGEFSLPQAGPHPGVQIERRDQEDGHDPAATAATLDTDIIAALLIAPQALVTSGWLNHHMAATFAGAVNDYLIERWLPVDDRFRLALAVSSHDGELAAREIERLGDDPRVAAVVTSPVAVNMGQRHYHPIYAAAQERDLPVVVHPGGFEGAVIGPAALGGTGPRTPEETFSLLPQVAMSNLASLIYDGVFERFDRLRVVFAGFGFGWVPPVLWRADAEWRGLRVEVPWLTRAPSEVAADHVRFVIDGASELDGDAPWTLATMLPDTALIFGSDAPFVPDQRARVARAPDSLRQAIERDNALTTFPRLRAIAALG